MTRLNQTLAIEKQVKNNAYSQLTELHKVCQRALAFGGLSRTYEPLDEDGEKFPPENHQVQIRVTEVISEAKRVLTPFFDITLQRDLANTNAKADLDIDGTVLLRDVPAVYLLWLEKQLVDLHKFVSSLPALSQDESWEYDVNQDCYRTQPVKTSKQKKVSKPLVKYEATKEHPAQVDIVTDDVLQGYWTLTKYSGAMSHKDIRDMKLRCEALLKAVKFAREQANLVEVQKVQAGEKILAYLFDG